MYFDTDIASKFNNKPYDRSHMKDILNKYYGYLEKDYNTVKDAWDTYYGHYKSIKVYQTEIKSGDRKGLYTTVIFGPDKLIIVKKDVNESNDILIAIAYAYMKSVWRTNSHYKAIVDKNTVKIGKDYAINLWSDFFVPGEILKRKRWDIYNYIAVQELFRKFSTRDIIDALDNVTYTVKEK